MSSSRMDVHEAGATKSAEPSAGPNAAKRSRVTTANPLNYLSTAAQMQAELQGLSNIHAVSVVRNDRLGVNPDPNPERFDTYSAGPCAGKPSNPCGRWEERGCGMRARVNVVQGVPKCIATIRPQ